MSKKKKPPLGINVPDLLAGRYSAGTVNGYSLAWRYYAEFATTLENAMKPSTLIAWRQHMVLVDRYSAGTINSRLNGVKTIAKQLSQHGKVNRAQYLEFKEVEQIPPTSLRERRRPNNRVKIEPEQMRALCKAPPVSEDNICALRDRALFMTLATTGCRISEVLRIKFNDIERLPNGNYVVRNVVAKRHAEARTVPLSADTYSAILDWIEFRPIPSEYIFTAVMARVDGAIIYLDYPINRNSAGSRVKMYGRMVGLPDIKPHDFRRFAITQIIGKKGIRAAQKVAGHSSPATTALYDLDDDVSGLTEDLF